MQFRLDESGITRASLGISAATAVEAIAWAWREFGVGGCVLASMQDAVLIDLAMRVDVRVPVVFLDNGYHFAETHETRRQIERHYGIKVEVVGPLAPHRGDVRPGECCDTKADLLDLALQGRDCWITGISRVQTPERADAALIERDSRDKIKVNPLAQWDEADRSRYIDAHQIITHPLLAQGYESIGCEPCTSRTVDGTRSGRWAGTERTECGLHL